MVHHLHHTTLLPLHPTHPLYILDLTLNHTQSLLLNQFLSPSITSQCTNRILNLILSRTQSLPTNRTPNPILSLNTSSLFTSLTPSNTQNLILNLNLTILTGPPLLNPSTSQFMNPTLRQLTSHTQSKHRRITLLTQSQSPSHTIHRNPSHTTNLSPSLTTHLSQNLITLHTNLRPTLSRRHTTHHRTSTGIIPTPLNPATVTHPLMEHIHHLL